MQMTARRSVRKNHIIQMMLVAALILIGILYAIQINLESDAEQLLHAAPEAGTEFQYGTSGQGRPLMAYRFGSGENVMVLNFAIHGYEDLYEQDGMALVYTAHRLMERLDTALPEGWTVYVIPCSNPDGLIEGTTSCGPGRCTMDGLDINRCFPTGWAPMTQPRYANGTAPLVCPEAQALAQLLADSMGTGENICIDVHGWFAQILTSDGADSSLFRAFAQYFPENTWADVNNGAGYFTAYAAELGYRACLFEFPAEHHSFEAFTKSGDIDRFLNSIYTLLEGEPA